MGMKEKVLFILMVVLVGGATLVVNQIITETEQRAEVTLEQAHKTKYIYDSELDMCFVRQNWSSSDLGLTCVPCTEKFMAKVEK